MQRVIVESPYGSKDPATIARNLRYLRACMLDCLARGEAPFASHALYTQPGVLLDSDPDEREKGIEAGLVWGEVAQKTVVYTDLGISRGMQYGIANARARGRPYEIRQIGGWEEVIRERCAMSADSAGWIFPLADKTEKG